jgi:hypothetical protein
MLKKSPVARVAIGHMDLQESPFFVWDLPGVVKNDLQRDDCAGG